MNKQINKRECMQQIQQTSERASRQRHEKVKLNFSFIDFRGFNFVVVDTIAIADVRPSMLLSVNRKVSLKSYNNNKSERYFFATKRKSFVNKTT